VRRRYLDRLHKAISDIESWNLVNPLEHVVTMRDIYRRANALSENLSDTEPAAACSKAFRVRGRQRPQPQRQLHKGLPWAFPGGLLLPTPA